MSLHVRKLFLKVTPPFRGRRPLSEADAPSSVALWFGQAGGAGGGGGGGRRLQLPSGGGAAVWVERHGQWAGLPGAGGRGSGSSGGSGGGDGGGVRSGRQRLEEVELGGLRRPQGPTSGSSSPLLRLPPRSLSVVGGGVSGVGGGLLSAGVGWRRSSERRRERVHQWLRVFLAGGVKYL